ncbi:MAG: response regulator [Candidatus Cloacimonetes bacterium]|jgi:PAS domain S-box-containing protein|nr:response regulator [Candidatus Cloacimonadota bacterium]
MESKTILIVEDEKIIAEDIKNTLLKFKYKIPEIISSGEKAIQKAKELKPDLILMDIMIEGKMNGIEAARQIYRDLEIPIVFLTAFADDNILEQAAESSPFGYLIKPFEDRELRATIEMAFYKFKMELALRKNRNFLLKVIDTVPNNIFVKDKIGKYLMVNDSVAELYNTTPKNMIGKTDRELIKRSKIKNEDIENIIKDDLNVIAGKKRVLIPEESLTLDNGKKIWFQTTKVPLDSPDVPEVLLGVSVDITALKNSYNRLQELMEETVNGLVSAVEKRDPYTAGHQRRVSLLANAIANKMNLEQSQADGLRIAAIVHDIGIIYVPSEILSKPGKLTHSEFELVKTHSQAGFEILSTINFPWPIAEIVLQHQERLNGSGYPNGLKGDDIVIEAQIIAVADVVEAIASHRPYRPSLGIDFALKEIDSQKRILFNEKVVNTCLNLFKNKEFAFPDSK